MPGISCALGKVFKKCQLDVSCKLEVPSILVLPLINTVWTFVGWGFNVLFPTRQWVQLFYFGWEWRICKWKTLWRLQITTLHYSDWWPWNKKFDICQDKTTSKRRPNNVMRGNVAYGMEWKVPEMLFLHKRILTKLEPLSFSLSPIFN